MSGEPNDDAHPVHRFEQAFEVANLEPLELLERVAPVPWAGSQDDLLNDGEAFTGEHVLGAGKPDTLGTRRSGRHCHVRRIGVRPHLKPPVAVRPRQQGFEGIGWLRGLHRERAEVDASRGAVDRQGVAFSNRLAADPGDASVSVDNHGNRAGDNGDATAPGHNGTVRCLASVRSEEAG